MALTPKQVILPLIVFWFSLTLVAQTKVCPLAPEQLPEVRGFKLGMSVEQIRKVYPHFVSPEADEFGFAEFRWDFRIKRGAFESFGEESSREPLDGIDEDGLAVISLAFLDTNLVAFAVSYDDAIKWGSAGEFLNAILKSFKLPDRAQWTEVDRGTLEYECGEYLLRATIRPKQGGGSGIGFYRLGVAEEIKKRKSERDARRRRDFRP